MISRPTLFILGAGASIPYGFPSGAELRLRMCFTHNEKLPMEGMDSEFHSRDINSFKEAFKNSHIGSIDAFLAKRPEFADIGKYCIAYILCGLEHPVRINQPHLPNDDWYFALWNALMVDVHTIDDFRLNRLKIATFNYDRSLEYFLRESIKNTFGMTDELAMDEVNKLSILHVYGQLGELGPNSNTSREYNSHSSFNIVNVAAKGIHIIPDIRDNDEVFDKVRGWFYEAERVVFLGFGFDDLNVRRLNISKSLSYRDSNPQVFILSSTFGKTEAEAEVAKLMLLESHQSKCLWKTSNTTNLQTLRDHAWVLR